MGIPFKDKIEEIQGKQLQKILTSNISNIPAACKKMGFKPLKEVDGVHIGNKGKVFDSIIAGSANGKTYAILVRKGGDFVPITDPDEAVQKFIETLSDEMNKSQKVTAVAEKIASLIA